MRHLPSSPRRGRGAYAATARRVQGVLNSSESLGSRGQLLKLAVVGSGAILLGGVPIEKMFGASAQAPSASQDRKILKFALLLEYLQASFYAEALAHARLTGELREFAEVVGGHEQAHVDYIKKALGPYAQRRVRSRTLVLPPTTAKPRT
jgi:hypothetical protein